MKTCTSCLVEKPLDQFVKHGSTRDGRHTQCNACRWGGVQSVRMAEHNALRAQGLRRCKRCTEIKPLDEFKRYRSGPHASCIQCEVEGRRGAYSPTERRAQQMKYNYGITVEQYADLLATQDGRCAICGSDVPRGKLYFAIDHDHECCPGTRSCGKCVRGLLCTRCNPMLGFAGNSVEILQAAIRYLQRL